MSRYAAMFEGLARKKEGAFVPFWMLGDPDLKTCFERIVTLVESGADALELGIPFSDPVADGPVVQRAAMRALHAHANLDACFELLSKIRAKYPQVPIGLLTYANLCVARGEDWFYGQCAASGVDSVLLADVPTLEAEFFCKAAYKAGVDPVLIAPPNASDAQLKTIAQWSKGYVYGVTRAGVTGANETLVLSASALIEKLREYGAPPMMLGFGISKPEHVKQALAQGAAGAISGSAIVQLGVDEPGRLGDFVKQMKQATRD
ncbi:MAG: tryptophan synthase subunit alpha [Myxococcota bacterium]